MNKINSITENFKAIIEKQKRLKYHLVNIIRRPATNVEIVDAEKKLGFNFNEELKELYTIADGTNTDNFEPSGLIGLIPIHIFLRLEDAVSYYNTSIEFNWAFINDEKRLRPGKKLFPFLEDGAGNCYWVDLNDGTDNYGKIFWTNTFGQQPDYEFSSLSYMLQAIAVSYTDGIFWTDENGFLDCDFDAFDKVCKSYA